MDEAESSQPEPVAVDRPDGTPPQLNPDLPLGDDFTSLSMDTMFKVAEKYAYGEVGREGRWPTTGVVDQARDNLAVQYGEAQNPVERAQLGTCLALELIDAHPIDEPNPTEQDALAIKLLIDARDTFLEHELYSQAGMVDLVRGSSGLARFDDPESSQLALVDAYGNFLLARGCKQLEVEELDGKAARDAQILLEKINERIEKLEAELAA